MGSALAWALCALIRGFQTPVQQLRGLSVTPLIVLLGLLIALLIGLASGIVPSLAAARKSILEALRHTG